MLLTSELVSRAVDGCRAPGETVELSVWMPSDVVRVEIRAPRMTFGRPRPLDEVDYELLLVRSLADRWSEEVSGEEAHVWFEIDRQRAPVGQLVALDGGAAAS